jgi:hypothetical protein
VLEQKWKHEEDDKAIDESCQAFAVGILPNSKRGRQSVFRSDTRAGSGPYCLDRAWRRLLAMDSLVAPGFLSPRDEAAGFVVAPEQPSRPQVVGRRRRWLGTGCCAAARFTTRMRYFRSLSASALLLEDGSIPFRRLSRIPSVRLP